LTSEKVQLGAGKGEYCKRIKEKKKKKQISKSSPGRSVGNAMVEKKGIEEVEGSGFICEGSEFDTFKYEEKDQESPKCRALDLKR